MHILHNIIDKLGVQKEYEAATNHHDYWSRTWALLSLCQTNFLEHSKEVFLVSLFTSLAIMLGRRYHPSLLLLASQG